MMRLMFFLLLMLAPGPPAFGQGFNPYQLSKDDPRSQRARRETCVTFVGHVARKIVEEMGDDACYALANCSPGVGRRLSEFYNCGDFEKQILRPRDLLKVIAQRGAGDPVALYALENAAELGDIDYMNAYLASPLHYTCGIKKLADGAAEVRARRLQMEAANAPVASQAQLPIAQAPAALPGIVQPVVQHVEANNGVLVILGCAALVGLVLWYRRRQQEQYGAA